MMIAEDPTAYGNTDLEDRWFQSDQWLLLRALLPPLLVRQHQSLPNPRWRWLPRTMARLAVPSAPLSAARV